MTIYIRWWNRMDNFFVFFWANLIWITKSLVAKKAINFVTLSSYKIAVCPGFPPPLEVCILYIHETNLFNKFKEKIELTNITQPCPFSITKTQALYTTKYQTCHANIRFVWFKRDEAVFCLQTTKDMFVWRYLDVYVSFILFIPLWV